MDSSPPAIGDLSAEASANARSFAKEAHSLASKLLEVLDHHSNGVELEDGASGVKNPITEAERRSAQKLVLSAMEALLECQQTLCGTAASAPTAPAAPAQGPGLHHLAPNPRDSGGAHASPPLPPRPGAHAPQLRMPSRAALGFDKRANGASNQGVGASGLGELSRLLVEEEMEVDLDPGTSVPDIVSGLLQQLNNPAKTPDAIPGVPPVAGQSTSLLARLPSLSGGLRGLTPRRAQHAMNRMLSGPLVIGDQITGPGVPVQANGVALPGVPGAKSLLAQHNEKGHSVGEGDGEGNSRGAKRASGEGVDGDAGEEGAEPDAKKAKRPAVPAEPAGSLLPHDGWDWRKYGRKLTTGQPYPRSYFKCARADKEQCPAKKQAERCSGDPTKWRVRYIGHHNHPQPPPRPVTITIVQDTVKGPPPQGPAQGSAAKPAVALPPGAGAGGAEEKSSARNGPVAAVPVAAAVVVAAANGHVAGGHPGHHPAAAPVAGAPFKGSNGPLTLPLSPPCLRPPPVPQHCPVTNLPQGVPAGPHMPSYVSPHDPANNFGLALQCRRIMDKHPGQSAASITPPSQPLSGAEAPPESSSDGPGQAGGVPGADNAGGSRAGLSEPLMDFEGFTADYDVAGFLFPDDLVEGADGEGKPGKEAAPTGGTPTGGDSDGDASEPSTPAADGGVDSEFKFDVVQGVTAFEKLLPSLSGDLRPSRAALEELPGDVPEGEAEGAGYSLGRAASGGAEWSNFVQNEADGRGSGEATVGAPGNDMSIVVPRRQLLMLPPSSSTAMSVRAASPRIVIARRDAAATTPGMPSINHSLKNFLASFASPLPSGQIQSTKLIFELAAPSARNPFDGFGFGESFF